MGQAIRFRKRRDRPKRERAPFRIASLVVAAIIVLGSRDFLAANLGDPVRAVTTIRFTPCTTGHRYNCVVDGDTFWFQGEKIRIADINTPETHRPACTREKALGERATRRLLSLLNDGPFKLEHTGDRDTDFFGRKLRVVTRNGRSLGQVLIAEGLARPWVGRRHSWCT
ncbi:MAG: thermonuclease family protein [Alphaproteobacteria bacterium]|nr:MAG: thermonuclease family protein [Alphaproteobacteria bacterium]